MITPWHALTAVAMVCGAVVPGPCGFNPDPRWDCSLGDPCPSGFACADDGFCKSADVACGSGQALCEYAALDDVGICVDEAAFASDPAHCGGCFQRCRGGAVCTDGVCDGEPAAGACLTARGHYDCPGGDVCVDDDGDGVGACVAGDGGPAGTFDGCDDGDDCAGGLCHDGLCTRPCDIGCPAASVCSSGAGTGGVCIVEAEACSGATER